MLGIILKCLLISACFGGLRFWFWSFLFSCFFFSFLLTSSWPWFALTCISFVPAIRFFTRFRVLKWMQLLFNLSLLSIQNDYLCDKWSFWIKSNINHILIRIIFWFIWSFMYSQSINQSIYEYIVLVNWLIEWFASHLTHWRPRWPSAPIYP